MMRCYLDGLPSRDFRIDLATGEIIGETEDAYRGRTERLQTGAA